MVVLTLEFACPIQYHLLLMVVLNPVSACADTPESVCAFSGPHSTVGQHVYESQERTNPTENIGIFYWVSGKILSHFDVKNMFVTQKLWIWK